MPGGRATLSVNLGLYMSASTDCIEKKVLLRVPRARVWRAISDAQQFGSWFGVAFEGDFVVGTRLVGRILPTQVDAEIAKMQQPYAGTIFECYIERIEPMQLFSFRWHPYAVEPGVDYGEEPMTLVTFELDEVSEGTQLTITESGFDRIPLARRVAAFEADREGWEMQTRLIEKYLALAPR
jgi:uncharacterized protein YndB with AHSA1/START domain